MTKSRPIALGFTEGITALDELRQRVAAGHHDFAIMMAGGAAISRKDIRLGAEGLWVVTNGIDDTVQHLKTPGLWTDSHIGQALDKRALLDMDGNDGIINVAQEGWVNAKEWEQKLKDAVVPDDNSDPLVFRLTSAPGAIRLGNDDECDAGEWEPADPSLLIEPCDIGAYTVAQIDLAAISFGFADGRAGSSAATSIELTIEDIDTIIKKLTAIRQNAIDVRGFTLKGENGWSNDLYEE